MMRISLHLRILVFILYNLVFKGGTVAATALTSSGASLLTSSTTTTRANAPDNRGMEFIIAFMENFPSDHQLELFVTTSRKTNVNVQVTSPKWTSPAINQQFTIIAGTVKQLFFNVSLRLEGSVKESKGILVKADDEVVIFGVNKVSYSADAFLGLPVDVLGKEYYAVTYYPPFKQTQICVAGVEDNTRVSFKFRTCSNCGSVSYDGQTYGTGSTLTVTLNKYDAIQLQSSGDLTGTYITSDKPVTAFSGNKQTNTIPDESKDHLVEQLTPVDTWGKRFATVPTPERTIGDYYKIIASEENTVVKYKCDNTGKIRSGNVTLAKASDTNQFSIDSNYYCYITADKAILLVVIVKSQIDKSEPADPSMIIIPPIEQYAADYTFLTPKSTRGSYTNYFMFIVNKLEKFGLLLDGQPFPSDTVYNNIPDTDLVGGYTLITEGSHTVRHTSPISVFGGFLYGMALHESYGFTTGMRMAKINTVCVPSPTVVGDGIDNDCDGLIDEELCTVENQGRDDDKDGVTEEDCATPPPNKMNKPCPSSLYQNITWKKTYPGHVDYQKCPIGFQGYATRLCRNVSSESVWAEPSLINCTREQIAEVIKKVKSIKAGTGSESLLSVLREFTNESKEISFKNQTQPSDIKSSVEVLKTVSEILQIRDSGLIPEETEAFVLATDAILSTKNKESWNQLNLEIKDDIAARVMTIVSNVSSSALKTINQTVIVQGENIVLKIEKTRIGNVKFPGDNAQETIASSILFSRKTIENSLNVTGYVKYSAVYYKTLGSFLDTRQTNQTLGSQIIAFSVPKEDLIMTQKLDPPIKLYFKTAKTHKTLKECAYWNVEIPNSGGWSTDGCYSFFSNESFTECHCDHLTNFAVLMSVREVAEDHHNVLSMFSSVGCIISITCLVLTVIVYAIQWRHHSSDKAVLLMLLCITLIAAYVVFLGGINRTEIKGVCTGVALVLHFLFLSVLFLMVAEGIVHVIMVLKVFPSRQSANNYLIPMSYGIPVVIVVTSAAVTKLEGYGTDKFCWLSIENGLIYAFFGPCAFGVLVSLVITVVLLKKLFSTRATMNKSTTEKVKTGIRSVLILAPLFGLTWLFGLFSFHEDAVLFTYVFVSLNSLQGFLIFIMHTVMNKTVQKQLNRKLSNLRRERDISSSLPLKQKKNRKKMITPDTKTTSDGKCRSEEKWGYLTADTPSPMCTRL